MKLQNSALLALTLILGSSTQAAVIGLMDTGVNTTGSLIPDGATQPGWLITAVDPANPPGGLVPPSAPHVVPAYPLGWIPNNDVSKWISYTWPFYTGGDIYREFSYSLTFHANPGDHFFMRVAGDNGTTAYLNQSASGGQLLDWGSKDGNNWMGFGSWSPWTEVSGFDNGDNTLSFVVYNLDSTLGNNPTGLRVEFSLTEEGTTSSNPVPESGELITPIFGAVLVSFAYFRRRLGN